MAHHITVEYDYWFIAYDENYENLVEGEGLAGTRIDTAKTYLELFETIEARNEKVLTIQPNNE
jgi:hypothetical protein